MTALNSLECVLDFLDIKVHMLYVVSMLCADYCLITIRNIIFVLHNYKNARYDNSLVLFIINGN